MYECLFPFDLFESSLLDSGLEYGVFSSRHITTTTPFVILLHPGYTLPMRRSYDTEEDPNSKIWKSRRTVYLPFEHALGDVDPQVGLCKVAHGALERVLEADGTGAPEAAREPLPDASGVEEDVEGEHDGEEDEVAEGGAEAGGEGEGGGGDEGAGGPEGGYADSVDGGAELLVVTCGWGQW